MPQPGPSCSLVADQYVIEHVGNCLSLEEVKDKVTELSPEIIYSASMWTPEQAAEMQAVARKVKPEIKTHAIPQGLQVLEGPDAIVAHLTKALPMLL